jgi:hypothetical protein
MNVRTSQALMAQICEACGIDGDNVRRVIVDAAVDHAIVVFVELFGDERMLQIAWADIAPHVVVSMQEPPQ